MNILIRFLSFITFLRIWLRISQLSHLFNFLYHLLLHMFLLSMFHLLLSQFLLLLIILLSMYHHLLISLFPVLYPWHVSPLVVIGLFITWAKWMSHVLTVGLGTGHLRDCPNLLNLACAVIVERLKSRKLRIHHLSFSIFYQAKRMYARSFVNTFAIIIMHWP